MTAARSSRSAPQDSRSQTSLRWGPDDARRMFAAFKASGLSIAEFTRKNGITPQRYYFWRAKIAKLDAASKSSISKPPRSLLREIILADHHDESIGVPTLPSPSRSIRVQFGLLHFEVDAQSDASALKSLLQAILSQGSAIR